MALIPLKFEPTKGLAAELRVHDEGFDDARLEARVTKLKKRAKTAHAYFERHLALQLRELAAYLDCVAAPLKVLDVGFGSGASSLLLASRGHDVSGVEPSRRAAHLLDGLASHYGYRMKIYQGPAEAMDQIEENGFDLIVFNSSFHHCDEPARVLSECRRLIRPNGTLFLHEPILKPYRTKAWYDRMLREQPARVGHYGGNEHIYYAWEYQRLLRQAGFANVKTETWIGLSAFREEAKRLAGLNEGGKPVHSRPKIAAYVLGHALLAKLATVRPIGRALTSLSLIPVNFVASPG